MGLETIALVAFYLQVSPLSKRPLTENSAVPAVMPLCLLTPIILLYLWRYLFALPGYRNLWNSCGCEFKAKTMRYGMHALVSLMDRLHKNDSSVIYSTVFLFTVKVNGDSKQHCMGKINPFMFGTRQSHWAWNDKQWWGNDESPLLRLIHMGYICNKLIFVWMIILWCLTCFMYCL